MLKFIVTGTGRCGTVFMAKWLTSVGLPCGHESIFNYESQEMILARLSGQEPPVMSDVGERTDDGLFVPDLEKLVADSSYMVVPYLDLPEVKSLPIVHLVRHPLRVISSFVLDLHYFQELEDNVFNTHNWEQWIYEHCPDVKTVTNPIERAVVYYIRWNRAIEQCRKDRPYTFHRIESSFSPNLYHFLKIDPPVKKANVYNNDKANTMYKKGKARIVMADIPEGDIKDELREIMADYCYDLTRML
jgi:hypothetical protein